MPVRYRLLDAALYLLPPWSTRRRRRLVAVEGPPPPPEEEEEGGEQQPVPRPTRSGHLLRGSGISGGGSSSRCPGQHALATCSGAQGYQRSGYFTCCRGDRCVGAGAAAAARRR